MERAIVEAVAWLREQAEKTAFGSIGVTLVIHNGIVVRVERLVVTKVQTDTDPVLSRGQRATRGATQEPRGKAR